MIKIFLLFYFFQAIKQEKQIKKINKTSKNSNKEVKWGVRNSRLLNTTVPGNGTKNSLDCSSDTRNSLMLNVGNHPKRKMDVAQQYISLSKEPRFIKLVGVWYVKYFGVGPAHNTQNNLAPNILQNLLGFPYRQK